MKIAFDIDDTLWKIQRDYTTEGKEPSTVCPCGYRYKQAPDYELIAVLKWFYENGDEVFVWSAGGMEYAQVIVDKLGLDGMVTVISKEKDEARNDIDIAFDDCEVGLGKVNVLVKREEKHCELHKDRYGF